VSLGASNEDRNGPIEIETRCGRVHADGTRCGRRLGPWSLKDGQASPSLKMVVAPEGARHLPRSRAWRPADNPVRLESYLQPSELSIGDYRSTRWWALCPSCGVRPVVREATMVRLMREAAGRGETFLYVA
jgi:hypothetical protein